VACRLDLDEKTMPICASPPSDETADSFPQCNEEARVHNRKENVMIKRIGLFAMVTALLVAGVVIAQQFPLLDKVAGKVVEKYQSSNCEQLWQAKGQPKSPEEQRVIGLLKSDQAMRTEFINRVAAPIANKMFECGMIP
jgi:hypothetical protein